jgi:hypothetical protein
MTLACNRVEERGQRIQLSPGFISLTMSWSFISGNISVGDSSKTTSLLVAQDLSGFQHLAVNCLEARLAAKFKTYELAVCPTQQTVYRSDNRNPGPIMNADHSHAALA